MIKRLTSTFFMTILVIMVLTPFIRSSSAHAATTSLQNASFATTHKQAYATNNLVQDGGFEQQVDNNPATVEIAANGNGHLYQLHTDGSIWLYQGPPVTGWQRVDNNPATVALSGAY